MKRHVQFVPFVIRGQYPSREEMDAFRACQKEIIKTTKAISNITNQLATNPKAEKRHVYLVLKTVALTAYLTSLIAVFGEMGAHIKQTVFGRIQHRSMRVKKQKPWMYCPPCYDRRDSFRNHKISLK